MNKLNYYFLQNQKLQLMGGAVLQSDQVMLIILYKASFFSPIYLQKE